MTDLLVSVVIPVHNEERQIEQCLRSAVNSFIDGADAFSRDEVEFLIVDARSSDNTPQMVARLCNELAEQGVQVFSLISDQAGRAQQMNYGAAKAKGEALLFLHSDTRLGFESNTGISTELRKFLKSSHAWGFCTVSFDAGSWQFSMLRFMINLRSRLFSISTGDQTQFVKAGRFRDIGGFASQPLMEDIELSKALKHVSKPYVASTQSITSARKWTKEGFWRTVLLMWHLRYSYWRGASAESIHKRYYKAN